MMPCRHVHPMCCVLEGGQWGSHSGDVTVGRVIGLTANVTWGRVQAPTRDTPSPAADTYLRYLLCHVSALECPVMNAP